MSKAGLKRRLSSKPAETPAMPANSSIISWSQPCHNYNADNDLLEIRVIAKC